MTRKPSFFATGLIAALVSLSACSGFESPTEPQSASVGAATGTGSGTAGAPQGVQTDVLTDGTDLVSSVLVGAEELRMSFLSSAPVGETESYGDSLSVDIINLLSDSGTLLTSRSAWGSGPSFNEVGSTSSTGTLEEGEPISVTGTVKTQTKKVKRADGSTWYETESSVTGYTITGRRSGAQCRQDTDFMFSDGNPETGATTFTQQVRSKTVCPGEGRVLYVHILLHFTVTPASNGREPRVTSNVNQVKVSPKP